MTDDPFRIAEWRALEDVCMFVGCENDQIDQRAPVFLRDGSMHKACTEHWAPIMRICGEQATWERDAMRSVSS